MTSDKVPVPLGQKIEGSLERLAGHMLPGTDLGHELKAEGALKKGDLAKAEKAAGHLPGGVVVGYAEGAGERTLDHALPGTTTGHELKAQGAVLEGETVKAKRTVVDAQGKSSWGGPY